MKLAVVLGSTRQNRVSDRLAKWVAMAAGELSDTEVELLDLRDYSMPFFNEPLSPRFNEHRDIDPTARQWLAKLLDADAYVFVTPEYNHSIPGVLKNALDYVTWEFVHKPATVVSHGSVGGARATMMLKEILSESRAVVIPTQVAVSGVKDKIDEKGVLSEEQQALPLGPQTSLSNALSDLKWYSDALAAARTKTGRDPARALAV